jgi:hypothetical protein
MYVELLAKSERCIEQQHDHELTVLALWEKVKALAAKEHFVLPATMSDFECLLDGDKRFRLSEMKTEDGEKDTREMSEEDAFLDGDEIEGLGFDNEQKVTLARFWVDDDVDDGEDEAFAPRPFEKNEDHVDRLAEPPLKRTPKSAAAGPVPKRSPAANTTGTPQKKTSAAGEKKTIRKKKITKRK